MSGQTGQVGVEAVVAVGLLMMVFVIVLFVCVQNNAFAVDFAGRSSSAVACGKIASAIERAYAIPGIDMNFRIDLDANVYASEITVGEYYCDYVGKAQSAQLGAGAVNAKRVGSAVVLKNV